VPSGFHRFKAVLRQAIFGVKLALSVLWYAATGRTLSWTLRALISLHSASNGRTTAWLAKWMGSSPLADIERISSSSSESPVFEALRPADRKRVLEDISETGFAILPMLLPQQACAELLRFAELAPGVEWTVDGPTRRRVTFNELSRDAAKLQFDPQDLIALPPIQDLMADAHLLSLLQGYFGHMPIFDTAEMWWSIASDRTGSAEIAQMFHYDLDRLRWLKLFVYLTEVGPETGPHVFVEGSHRLDGHNAELLRRGYVRIPDDDIYARYGIDKVRELCGPAGTMLIVDTKGMHKGKTPKQKNRLIAELQFSSCRFGHAYPRLTLPRNLNPSLKKLMSQYPSVYRQLTAAP
jgi:hypothetical protein